MNSSYYIIHTILKIIIPISIIFNFLINRNVASYNFIVINKNSLIPLVWDFAKTKTIGDLQLQGGKSHKDFTLRDPYVIGSELSEYLKSTPIVPNGINIGEGKSNSIENWIKECG